MDAIEFEEIKQFAPEFISSIAENAAQTVLEWLLANNVPEEVRYLSDYSLMLERYSNQAEYGKMSDRDIKELTAELPKVTEYIARLGGEFAGPCTISTPRKDALIQAASETTP